MVTSIHAEVSACALRIDINSLNTLNLWNLNVLRKALDSTLCRIAMSVGLQIQKDVWKHRSTGCNGNADICRIAFQRRHDAVRCSVSFPQNVALLVLSHVHLLGEVFQNSWEWEGILWFSLGWKVHRKDLPVQKFKLREIVSSTLTWVCLVNETSGIFIQNKSKVYLIKQ